MWLVCGFRRFPCRPIFSQNTLNCDKHKYERFLQGGAGNFVVASVYGPATFCPAPTLLFRELPAAAAAGVGFAGAASALSVAPAAALPGPGVALVASGTLASADVDRVVLKRVVCTGYPVRVHKRTAIVKHMFYHPQDVAWFKPCGVYTKHGLAGHIVGSVGTHGLFRVHFGRAIMGHDTVCLPLYKRVFPKYHSPAHPRPIGAPDTADDDNDDDDGSAALTLPVL
jgi:pre-rRNA-processing protein TSR1